MDSGSRPQERGRPSPARFAGWLALLLLVISALLPTTVSANDKVFVCKYIDTPLVDERLQTGQNPISVSVNAIPDFQGIGSWFADKHGQSFVLAWDTGQPEPDVSACPQQTTTPNPTPTPTPGGGAAAEGDEPTLPPTNTALESARPAADQTWQLAFMALVGILGMALALSPKGLIGRRDR
jgi:hypothetical protein